MRAAPGRLLRSTFHWLYPLCSSFLLSFLILLGIIVDPRKNDGAQRMFCRVTMRLAGAKLVVRRAPGFDPARTCFFLVNHVNLFDPFVLYATDPAILPGTGARITLPDSRVWMDDETVRQRSRAGQQPAFRSQRMWRLLVPHSIPASASPFSPKGSARSMGVSARSRMACFAWRCNSGRPLFRSAWLVHLNSTRRQAGDPPGHYNVYLHDVIETKDLHKDDVPALRDRVHAIISGPFRRSSSWKMKEGKVGLSRLRY